METRPEAAVAVVVPAFRPGRRLEHVLRGMPAFVKHVIVVDDGSPDDAARAAANAVGDPRVRVVRHRANLGVGAAMLSGYAVALDLGADVVVKVDADGQMDPANIPRLLAPIARGEADYTKGNRFLVAFPPTPMPPLRLLGNVGLTFLTKVASGYWHLFDPTNGYTAVHACVLRRLDPRAIARDYFFETSLLFELRRLGAVVEDVALPARYEGEPSSLSIPAVLVTFPPRMLVGLLRRLGRQYFLYDFSAASVLLLLGLPLLLFGVVWGFTQWYLHSHAGTLASTGTVLLAALPILVGVQFLVQALVLDIRDVPRAPAQARLADDAPAGAAPPELAAVLERNTAPAVKTPT